MKCRTVERWMLRDKQPHAKDEQPNSRTAPPSLRLWRASELRTKEISGWRERRIETHIESCAACRQWREDYQKLSAIAETALPCGEPSEKVLVNIRREARVRAAEPHAHTGWSMPWLRPAYGLATIAALCMVLIGGWWPRPDPNGFESEAQLSTILMMLEETADPIAETASLPIEIEAVASLDAVAQQLLTLQGLDDGYTDAELSTPGEVPQATDPLTRSSGVSRAERYG